MANVPASTYLCHGCTRDGSIMVQGDSSPMAAFSCTLNLTAVVFV